MAKLVTKFKYLKPDAQNSIGGYVKYIATREGVDKIDESYKMKPASLKQQQLIEKILRDFPDSKEMHEYDDYLKDKTVGNAAEFITRALEDNAYEMMNSKTYADYIATRPRAQRFGSHGLFTDDGVDVNLKKVSEELNLHDGNVWTTIISLRREDAERLGFNTGERWRDMLRTQSEALSTALNFPMNNLRWYAAFHNESHHPHVHLIAYSVNRSEGYLTKKGVNSLRSSFAKDIFAQDLLCIYEKQTQHRDELRHSSKELVAEIVEKINTGIYDNPLLEEKLLQLADRLSKTGGRKQYGYLKADVKAIVNSIVDELAKDERIAALYELWYEQREEVIRTYTEELPERIPLSQNTEFKSVRNAVIQEAMNIVADRIPMEDVAEVEVPEEEPQTEEAETDAYSHLSPKEKRAEMWKLYHQAKEFLDRESEDYNPKRAVELLVESATLGCTVAKYRLGKMFLYGEDVSKLVTYALQWLEEAADERNQYAEYLLGKTLLKGVDTEQDTKRGEELLRRSEEQGNRYAAYTLGKTLLDGELLVQDIPEAIRLLTKSADLNFAPAQYVLGKLLYQGEVIPQDVEKAIAYLERASAQKNPYAAYLAGKIRLTEEAVKDIKRAIKNFQIAAENGNDYAEYQLGKIYLYGKDVPRDFDKAMEYLAAASEHGNPYATQLLHSIRSNRNWNAAMGSIRLLHHLGRALQNRLEEDRKGKAGGIDRKLKRQIDEKKQAQGLKQG